MGAGLLVVAVAQAQSVPSALLEKMQKNACTACHSVDKKGVATGWYRVCMNDLMYCP